MADESGPIGVLLNGWFKAHGSAWPPHPKLLPLLYGFHIRRSQAPELLCEESIEFFRRHQPIGCRDPHTERLLRARGVEAFTSGCLSLTLPRRIQRPDSQTEVFVVSLDESLRAQLPTSLGPYRFVSHCSGSDDFEANMLRARRLLAAYRTRARLIVTTLLHCALPAIAMGVPVVVIYPINDVAGHVSDRERFSALTELVDVHHVSEIDRINWDPDPVAVSERKLTILDGFYEMATARWGDHRSAPLGPIASAAALPPP